jgi:hypothetical protein
MPKVVPVSAWCLAIGTLMILSTFRKASTNLLRGTAQGAAELRAQKQQQKEREEEDLRVQSQPGWFQKAH